MHIIPIDILATDYKGILDVRSTLYEDIHDPESKSLLQSDSQEQHDLHSDDSNGHLETFAFWQIHSEDMKQNQVETIVIILPGNGVSLVNTMTE